MIYKPYDYQRTAMRWILDNPRCGLFLDMGLGKTVSTLTAVQQLIDDCEVSRVLVVAPKKVAETTWSTEAEKWDHLQDLKVVKVLGTEKQRCAALAERQTYTSPDATTSYGLSANTADSFRSMC